MGKCFPVEIAEGVDCAVARDHAVVIDAALGS